MTTYQPAEQLICQDVVDVLVAKYAEARCSGVTVEMFIGGKGFSPDERTRAYAKAVEQALPAFLAKEATPNPMAQAA